VAIRHSQYDSEAKCIPPEESTVNVAGFRSLQALDNAILTSPCQILVQENAGKNP
jgi:hypothetical protein